jgi:NCS1 family nucleobase:cation symporter-1
LDTPKYLLTFIAAGFVRRVQVTNTGNGWDHVYDLSYFFGFLVSGITHWVLHAMFPLDRQRGSSPFEIELHRKREGQFTTYQNRSNSSGDEEVAVVADKGI